MNEIKILGLSGKKQSGKNTAGNYVVGTFLKALKITTDFEINNKGGLVVTDIFGNEEYRGVMDLNSRNPAFLEFAEENIFPFVKLYSYADLLKQHVCIDILGLSWDQCYGTDEDKNSPTHLKWEDMPNVTTLETPQNTVDEAVAGRLGEYYKKCFNGLTYHKPGLMTAREVMQFAGTEIFRKMYGNVWVDATIRKIKRESPSMGIITDVRFPNEVEGILNTIYQSDAACNGKVIRLTRDVFKGEDQHESETALDEFPLDHYSLAIDNATLSIAEQNQVLHDYLSKELWLPHEAPTELLERLPIE